MLGCKACEAVRDILGGVAGMYMLKTRHTAGEEKPEVPTPMVQFDSLAG